MILWFLLALMTGAAVLSLLWPLSSPSSSPELDGDVPFFKAQLAEIERDRARGLLDAAEAEAARIESGRRLLRAASRVREAGDATSEPALRRRRAASALSLSVVPIVGLAFYGALGSPQLQGASRVPPPPVAASADPGQPPGFEDAVRRVEEHLAANPDDARGWDVIAPIYFRVGRYADAIRAFSRARAVGGDTAERLLGEAEARTGAADGIVGPDAKALLDKAAALDPTSARGRYYLALAREQAGDGEGARTEYRSLLAGSAPDAAWVPLVKARLARLDGPSSGLPAQSGPPPLTVTPEIAAMVNGLDERLAGGGGSEAEWSRLVRSLVVLGRRDDALDRLDKARLALAGDPDAPRRLDRLAGDLGLPARAAATPRP